MPAGIAWQPGDVSLWTIETSDTVDRFEVRRRGEAAGTAIAARQPGTAIDTPRVPHGTRASGLAIVNAPASPFDGDVIVSSVGLADLLRFDGSRADPPAGDPVRLLQGRFGAIGGVTTTSSGDIYFFTAEQRDLGRRPRCTREVAGREIDRGFAGSRVRGLAGSRVRGFGIREVERRGTYELPGRHRRAFPTETRCDFDSPTI